MYTRFTDQARHVMELANQEALRFNHEYIGTEHILLGLMREGSGVAAKVLEHLDIDLQQIRREIELILQCGPGPVARAQLSQTPRAKKVIEYALEEARALNHESIGTEHLLLGLVREDQGVAAQVLRNVGLGLQAVREAVVNFLGDNGTSEKVGGAFGSANLDAEIQYLPEHAQMIVKGFDQQIELLQRAKETAVADMDFAQATMLRDLQHKLHTLRADLIRQWPKNS